MNKIAFKVKKAAERSILQGHPWVYESSIVKQSKQGEAGDLAIIFDQRKNQLMAVGLYDPGSVIRIRVLHVGGPARINQEFLSQQLSEAFHKRVELLKTETTAYRLVYGENDGMPGLIIDVYNQLAVIKLYSGIWIPFMEILTSILERDYKVDTVIVRLNRLLQRAGGSLTDGTVLMGTLEKEEVIFHEHGLKFHANLLKGHKTGYFLDHRHNRLQVRGLAKDRDVLDIFAYAGGFSVNALAGGARKVVSLDISEQALDVAKRNALLNFHEPAHEVMVVDAFVGLRRMTQEGRKFGLIICDPPSFAKSEEQVPGALKSYRRLAKVVVPLVAEGGIFLMCSCSSRIEKEEFYELVLEEVGKSGRSFQVLEKTDHDVDHPLGIKEMSYLKSVYIKL